MATRLLALGALGEFGANSLLVEPESGGNLLIDAGAAFSDLAAFGVGYEVPDFAALGGHGPKAVIVTHAHDDHKASVRAGRLAVEVLAAVRPRMGRRALSDGEPLATRELMEDGPASRRVPVGRSPSALDPRRGCAAAGGARRPGAGDRPGCLWRWRDDQETRGVGDAGWMCPARRHQRSSAPSRRAIKLRPPSSRCGASWAVITVVRLCIWGVSGRWDTAPGQERSRAGRAWSGGVARGAGQLGG
jgi:hypothetical protein